MSLIQKFSCGDVVENRYALDIQVHEGRWGDIFRATDRLNESPVAVRFFPNSEDGPQDFERFSSHARELSGLTEPIIAKPVDQGMADEIPYVVFRWAKGQNLEALLAEHGKLSLEDTVVIAAQVLEGLAAAHQSRLTHGLLRPVKIVVRGLDEKDPLVRIVDLQIWRFFEWSSGQEAFEASNLSRRIVRYMAPEVLENHRVRPPADLYALGLIIIEMLTGKPAFDANHRVALIAQQLSDEPAELDENVEAGPAFREFLAKLIAKDQEQRFSTATEALKVLQEKQALFLSELEEPAPKAAAPPPAPAEKTDAAPAEKLAQQPDDGDEAVAAAQEFESDREFAPDQPADAVDHDEADDELFGDDPDSMRSLSDGSSLANEEPLFEEELNFADEDDDLSRSSASRDSEGAPMAAGHTHRPDDQATANDDDDEFDPALADEIPTATGDDKRIAELDNHLRQTRGTPIARQARPARSKRPNAADAGLSTPVTIALSLLFVAIIGGASYVFLFNPDNASDVATEAEAAEPAPVPTFTLTVTTSPPAQTVLVEGRSRDISPMEVEISEDELPIAIRARTDRENVQEKMVTEPQDEIHFDLNQ